MTGAKHTTGKLPGVGLSEVGSKNKLISISLEKKNIFG